MPPAESGILGTALTADALTVTASLGHSLFDERFGLSPLKPQKFTAMTAFPNDRLDPAWCGGDILLQFCANSRETVIYALREVLRRLSGRVAPLWKIDGFLPARILNAAQHRLTCLALKTVPAMPMPVMMP